MKYGNASVCGLLLLIVLVSTAWGQEKKLTVVSYPARPPKLPLWLARDEGLFTKRGLNVILKELESNEELLGALGKSGRNVVPQIGLKWIFFATIVRMILSNIAGSMKAWTSGVVIFLVMRAMSSSDFFLGS